MASVRKIHYMVREFKRSKEGTPLYCGRVLRTRNVDRESLVDFLVGKNTTVTRQDIGAVLALLDEVIREQLVMGNSINTGLFRAVPAIRGTFESPDDEFEAGRHAMRVSVSATSELTRKFANEASPEKDRTAKRLPEIDRVYDYRSETYNDSVTPGGSAEITGANLDVTTEGADQGVYFANVATAARTAVTQVTKLTGHRIVFTVPETLSNGGYSLVVKRAFGNQTREGELETKLNVVSARVN